MFKNDAVWYWHTWIYFYRFCEPFFAQCSTVCLVASSSSFSSWWSSVVSSLNILQSIYDDIHEGKTTLPTIAKKRFFGQFFRQNQTSLLGTVVGSNLSMNKNLFTAVGDTVLVCRFEVRQHFEYAISRRKLCWIWQWKYFFSSTTYSNTPNFASFDLWLLVTDYASHF